VISACVVSFGVPPWQGGDAVVHLDEFALASLLLKCGEPFVTKTARFHVQSIDAITCDGCAAIAVARVMEREGG
jgi:hypothetical protein